jgi:cation:H+ antiporter
MGWDLFDGGILLAAFCLAVVALPWKCRRGIDIEPEGEVAETLEEAGRLSKWKALGMLLLSLLAIAVGSELLVAGSKTTIERLGLSTNFFGMTILALLVSIEEIARGLPATLKGRPEISYGNVVGSDERGTPIYIRDLGYVTLGPHMRRGLAEDSLDQESSSCGKQTASD